MTISTKSKILLTVGLTVSGIMTACAPYESFQPEQKKAASEKIVLPANLSENLAGLLLTGLNEKPTDYYTNSKAGESVSRQDFIDTFDMTGHGVVKGISLHKSTMVSSQVVPESNGKTPTIGKFDVVVSVYLRSLSTNREIQFSGQLTTNSLLATSGFKILEKTDENEANKNLNANLKKIQTCNGIDASMMKGLQQKDAYQVQAKAACFDFRCNQVVVSLELENASAPEKNSQVAFLFGTRNEVPELTDSSVPDVVSFEEAKETRLEEKGYSALCESSTPDADAQSAADSTVDSHQGAEGQGADGQGADGQGAEPTKNDTDDGGLATPEKPEADVLQQGSDNALIQKMIDKYSQENQDEDLTGEIETQRQLDAEAIDASVNQALEENGI